MNFCWKYVLHTLFFVTFFDPSFGAENINEGSLREISNKIISKDHIFDSIKEKLRKFHTNDAKNAWVLYDKTTLPKAIQQEYKKLIVGNLSGVTRNDVLTLVRDTKKTFYTGSEINSIEVEVKAAVIGGTVQINPKNENQILIIYDLNKNFGELCIKNEEPPLNPQCQAKQIIEIVLDAKNYIDYVRINGIADLENQNLACKINNIY